MTPAWVEAAEAVKGLHAGENPEHNDDPCPKCGRHETGCEHPHAIIRPNGSEICPVIPSDECCDRLLHGLREPQDPPICGQCGHFKRDDEWDGGKGRPEGSDNPDGDDPEPLDIKELAKVSVINDEVRFAINDDGQITGFRGTDNAHLMMIAGGDYALEAMLSHTSTTKKGKEVTEHFGLPLDRLTQFLKMVKAKGASRGPRAKKPIKVENKMMLVQKEVQPRQTTSNANPAKQWVWEPCEDSEEIEITPTSWNATHPGAPEMNHSFVFDEAAWRFIGEGVSNGMTLTHTFRAYSLAHQTPQADGFDFGNFGDGLAPVVSPSLKITALRKEAKEKDIDFRVKSWQMITVGGIQVRAAHLSKMLRCMGKEVSFIDFSAHKTAPLIMRGSNGFIGAIAPLVKPATKDDGSLLKLPWLGIPPSEGSSETEVAIEAEEMIV